MKYLILLVFISMFVGHYAQPGAASRPTRLWMSQEDLNAPCSDDAWVGVGVDRQVTSIGRVEHNKNVIPAIIQSWNTTRVYTFEGKIYTTEQVEVYCGTTAWLRLKFPARLPPSALPVGYFANNDPSYGCRTRTYERNSIIAFGVVDPTSLYCNFTYGTDGEYNQVAQNPDYEILMMPTAFLSK